MTHLPIFTHPSMPAHAPVAPLRRAISRTARVAQAKSSASSD